MSTLTPESAEFETWPDCFAAYEIAEHLQPGLERYLVQHMEPGQFLCSVLDNDLRGAVLRADEKSFACLPGLLRLLYNEAPAPALNRQLWVEGGRV